MSDDEVYNRCIRALKCQDGSHALMVYAETSCTWSTLLDDSMSNEDIENWIKEAIIHIRNNDMKWLEENFT